MSYDSYTGVPILKVFGSSTCPKCADAKSRLQDRNIPFKYYNVSTAKGLAEAAFYGLVSSHWPVLLLVRQDGEVVTRFRAVMHAISEIENRSLFSRDRQMSIPLEDTPEEDDEPAEL
ncbi:MAG: hypothetical protein JW941_10645 [Candidatus Coatesbacteria bacterium]|nr:hypothetical protein [Candidatus Coatesbacteria bacterium]